jgi:hypothetical protein
MRFVSFVTDFADQAVVLPLAITVAVGLWAAGWRRGALVWSGVIAGTFLLMLALKIGFGACGSALAGDQLESPSGHTAAAGVLYGGMLAFVAEELFGRTYLTLGAILLVVTVIGVSRVMLGAHTPLEVLVGALVGTIAAFLMVKGLGRPGKTSPPALLLLPLLAVLFLFHGLHFPAEAAIKKLTLHLSRTICPGPALVRVPRTLVQLGQDGSALFES